MAIKAPHGGPRPGVIVPVVMLGISLIAVSFSTRSMEGLPRRIGMGVGGLIQKGFAAVRDAVTDTVASIAELRQMKTQVDELSRTVESFSRLERDNADLRAENDRLKEQLGYSSSPTVKRIAARIIAKDPGLIYSGFTIDQGERDGVRRNMPVVAFQNGIEGVVGKVLEAGAATSIIVPIIDPRLHLSARLARTRYEGLVTGAGSAHEPLILRYVGKLAASEVQFGDIIVTSGQDSLYPPDIAIGRVREVRSPEFQSSAEILMDPALDFGRLEYVFVLDTTQANAAASSQAGPAGESKGGAPAAPKGKPQ